MNLEILTKRAFFSLLSTQLFLLALIETNLVVLTFCFRHAGYNVVEMNASDDRTLQAFKVKIEAATQMRSVISREKKPNCLVIDEIDGAPAATINHLINVISGKAGGKSKKKGGGGGDLLQRPIICICNDLFVPALRNLRPLAMVVNDNNEFRLKKMLSWNFMVACLDSC